MGKDKYIEIKGARANNLKNIDVKTSQVSIGEYADFFRKIFDEGKDILHLTLSSGISGSYTAGK